ncbi:DUF6296 family protein [Streptomyces sp. SP18CS02]|uniref:DUF6296 family protein n=1 Tax=Streptomyces sp. SP18CS02 TaxID=3002531 RepID=UPI002E7A0833|nr:DUF6296 family protein [Streptomyces sp. SP18CS02]MEE1757424.1 DUF6296 family protein [Streptomyces sp. SP18CS02]
MQEQPDRYELVFVHGSPSAAVLHGEDVVAVHRTDRKGPGGHPVYSDDTGIVLAEISDRGEVRMLASGGHQNLPTTVEARPARPA